MPSHNIYVIFCPLSFHGQFSNASKNGSAALVEPAVKKERGQQKNVKSF